MTAEQKLDPRVSGVIDFIRSRPRAYPKGEKPKGPEEVKQLPLMPGTETIVFEAKKRAAAS